MQKKVVVTRVFDAVVELVWKVWTEPQLVMRWWGPDKFTCRSAIIDFREGGRSLVNMTAPTEMGGKVWFSIWDYQKIIPLKRIEFIQNLADKNGTKMNPVSVGMPADFPEDIRTVVTFKELASNKTEMTVTEYADFGQTSHFAKLGLEQCFDKMASIFAKA